MGYIGQIALFWAYIAASKKTANTIERIYSPSVLYSWGKNTKYSWIYLGNFETLTYIEKFVIPKWEVDGLNISEVCWNCFSYSLNNPNLKKMLKTRDKVVFQNSTPPIQKWNNVSLFPVFLHVMALPIAAVCLQGHQEVCTHSLLYLIEVLIRRYPIYLSS